MGFNRRLLAAVLALMCLTGAALAERYPLRADMGEDGAKSIQEVATVETPVGFALQPSADPGAEEPEYYFEPLDESSPVRFYYYTAGSGDPDYLARAAMDTYALYYDEFQPGEITAAPLDGRDCLRFHYTCAYPNRDKTATVYEQTAVCYLPLRADRFAACIVSLAFGDAGDYLTDEALEAELTEAVRAISYSSACG